MFWVPQINAMTGADNFLKYVSRQLQRRELTQISFD